MGSYRDQEHGFRPFVREAVLPFLHCFSHQQVGAVVSTDEEDTRLSFDMRVGLWVPVSVRIRKRRYWVGGADFSIRAKTKYSGTVIKGELVKCELDKLRDGLGNAYFFGWLNNAGTEIENYIIVDINRLRPHLDGHYAQWPNDDGTEGRYYLRSFLSDVGAMVYQSWDESQRVSRIGVSHDHADCPF